MNIESPESKPIDCGSVGWGNYYPPPKSNIAYLSRPRPLPKQANALASLEIRDQVYREMGIPFALSETHLSHVTGPTRGLKDVSGLMTLPKDFHIRKTAANMLSNKWDLARIPGFFQHQGEWTMAGVPGILIPCRLPQGQIQGFQIRCDNPAKAKYVWFSSAGYPHGTSSGTFYHYTHATPRLDVWVCEGALKATIASQLTDEAFIGLPGCHISDVEVMVKPLPMIPRFILCPDADWRTNEAVKKAWIKNLSALQASGLEIRIANWEPIDGKGIDDVLLNKGRLPRYIYLNEWLKTVVESHN